jgi:hypothetical protein
LAGTLTLFHSNLNQPNCRMADAKELEEVASLS